MKVILRNYKFGRMTQLVRTGLYKIVIAAAIS